MFKHLIVFSSFVFGVGIIFGLFSNLPLSFDGACVQKDSINLTFSYILLKNLKVIFFIVSGGVTFGTTTVTNLLVNGYNLGMVTAHFHSCLGSARILLLTLPHGILEIPAIIIAGVAGFKIPYEIVRYLLGRKERILTREDIEEYLMLALISVTLIILAAWIEANVTLKIAKAILKAKGI